MRRYVTRNLLLIFLGIGFVLGGYFIELVDHHYDISFEPKLSLGDIINAGTVLIVALIVTYFLENHNKEHETVKSILLNQLESFLCLTQDFERIYETGKLVEITSHLKRIRMANDSFFCAVSEIKYPANFLSKELTGDIITEIRKLSTDTPISKIVNSVKKSNCNATVKNNIISLTSERKAQLDNKISQLKLAIFKLQISISKP